MSCDDITHVILFLSGCDLINLLAYSEILDHDCTKPGDEYLPLGPSFQVIIEYISHYASNEALILTGSCGSVCS